LDWISSPPESYLLRKNSLNLPYFVHVKAVIPEIVKVGAYTYFHGHTRVTGSCEMSIGSFCSVGNNVTFHCGDNHHTRYLSTYPLSTILGMKISYSCATGRGILIGSDVWIGEGVRILAGTEIANGAIIGAGSVVRGTVPPYSINIGNPSTTVKYRFNESTIALLLKLRWWDWDIERIKANSEIFNIDFSSITTIDLQAVLSRII
jgi:virginiamycin A acetyltransferase